MNNVVLVGRLTRDPEVRFTPTGAQVTTFTLAVDRDFMTRTGERQTDFIDIQVWNKQAESCGQYLSKGKMVSVQGSIRTESYTDRNGVQRKSWRINANRVQFLTPIGNNNNNGTQPQGETPMFEPNFEPSQNLNPAEWTAIDDEDIPF